MFDSFFIVSRSILDSDIFASAKKLKVWIWCISKAAYKDKSIATNIGRGESVLQLKRGQFLYGRNSASEVLGMPASSVHSIMKQFEKDGRITIKSNSHYSVITICNYDDYQDANNYFGQPLNRQLTGNGQPSDTNKERNNNNIYIYPFSENLILDENFDSDYLKYQEENFSEKKSTTKNLAEKKYSEFIDLFNKITGKNFRYGDGKAKRQFSARIKEGYSMDDFATAISNCKNDEFHMANTKYLTPEFITRSDKFMLYFNATQKPKSKFVL